ncbi:MAG: hypothetical protein F6K19_08325, partial [Cyanothece sp. SIO1E1]|nr:hypothetical protein [Cyanothece sp. SIO1E1]
SVELELLSTLGNILNLASIDPAQTEFQAAELEPVNRPQPDQPVVQPPPQSQLETLQQLLSIEKLQNLVGAGMGQAAETLTQLADSPIVFQLPVVETMTAESLQKLLQDRFGVEPICAAQLPFSGGLSGTAQLLLPQASAATFTTVLTGEEPGSPEFKQLKVEALTEVGNIVLNGVMGTISNALTQQLEFSVPVYCEDSIESLTRSLTADFNAAVLVAQTRFEIEQLQVEGDITLFFKMRLFFDLAFNS